MLTRHFSSEWIYKVAWHMLYSKRKIKADAINPFSDIVAVEALVIWNARLLMFHCWHSQAGETPKHMLVYASDAGLPKK